ncbi:hypothetical protein JMJ77_0001130 [Colletotrichum scovillei]|uniref:Uncharacterized protein n=1 Tax=Colletotrichum scovillei TaxID=1209932 RepID=A0A9P7UFN6_9PEZI|nr:hypothetical protein JMJ77_0001130 [Colletotrichum scovillei]KAG7080566.1 hypothetical protein JMJ78_0007657 [Colletotrichum scovillei]
MAPSKKSMGKLPDIPKAKQDAKVRKNMTARKNPSAKEQKVPKKGVKVTTRPKSRALIQWRREEPLLVTLLWVQYTCAKEHGKMPWDDIIPQCFTGVTSTAFTQFLARERKRLLKMGYCVPPLPSQAKSLERDQNIRGYINAPTADNENAIRPLMANAAGEGELEDGEADDAMNGESPQLPFGQDPCQAHAQSGHLVNNDEAQPSHRVHDIPNPQQQAGELLFHHVQQFSLAQHDAQNDAKIQQQPSHSAQYSSQHNQIEQANQEWQAQHLNEGNDMQLYRQAIEAWKHDEPPNEARIYVEGLPPMAYYLFKVPASVSGGVSLISGTEIMYPMRTENGYTTYAIPIPVNLGNYLDDPNGQDFGAPTPFGNSPTTNLAPGSSSLNEPAFQALSDGSSDVNRGGFNGGFQGEHHLHEDANHLAMATGSAHVGDDQGFGFNDFDANLFDFSQFH